MAPVPENDYHDYNGDEILGKEQLVLQEVNHRNNNIDHGKLVIINDQVHVLSNCRVLDYQFGIGYVGRIHKMACYIT